eukprot:scaffold111706_cov23-Prasinocladus_malaysianus.AAC.1
MIYSVVPGRAFERIGETMSDRKLLFSTEGVIEHGYGIIASFRAGFEEATGLRFHGDNWPSSGIAALMIAGR